MEIILLEKIKELGNIGTVVTVKNGYARNYLIPRKKAIRATAENKEFFEKERAKVEAENLKKKEIAEQIATKINGMVVNLIRQAGEDQRLYGSVTAKDIADALSAVSQLEIKHYHVRLNEKIKAIGIYNNTKIELHPDVEARVVLNVARSEQEAEFAKENFSALTEETAPTAPV